MSSRHSWTLLLIFGAGALSLGSGCGVPSSSAPRSDHDTLAGASISADFDFATARSVALISEAVDAQGVQVATPAGVVLYRGPLVPRLVLTLPTKDQHLDVTVHRARGPEVRRVEVRAGVAHL